MGEMDNIIRLIDFEVERVESEDKRPGWNVWALVGALGTCIWLAIGEFSGDEVSWVNVAMVFLLVSIVLDMLGVIREDSGGALYSASQCVRFIYTNALLRNSWRFWAFAALRAVLLLGVAMIIPLTEFGRISINVFLGIQAIGYALVLGLCFCRFPLPMIRIRSATTFLVSGVLLSSGGYGVYAITRRLTGGWIGSGIEEIRIGMLCAVGIVLFIFLFRGKRESHMIEALVGIRRNLLLGDVGIEEAQRQIEIALMGLRLNDVLQGTLNAVVGGFGDLNVQYDKAQRELDAIARMCEKAACRSNMEQKTVCESMFHSVQAHLDSGTEIAERIRVAGQKFRTQTTLFSKLSPAIQQEIEPLLRKVDEARRSWQERNEGLKQRISDSRKYDCELNGTNQLIQTK